MAISITKIVKDSYNGFINNRTLLTIGVVGALITSIISVAIGFAFADLSNIQNNPSTILALLASPTFWAELAVVTVTVMLVELFITGTIISAVAEGDKATIGDAVRNAASRYVSLVGTSVTRLVLCILGMIPIAIVFILLLFNRPYDAGIMLGGVILCAVLMIIPLYISLRLSLAEIACVIRGTRAIASIKGSWSMLKGNLWLILGISFCIGIIDALVGGLVSHFINSILGAFLELLLGYPSTIALALVYMQLAGVPGAAAKTKK
jgi:hypothetical protein